MPLNPKVNSNFYQYFNTGKIRNTSLKRVVEVEIIDGEFRCGSSSHELHPVHASFCSCPFPNPIKEVEEAGGKSGSAETAPTKTHKRTRDFSGLHYSLISFPQLFYVGDAFPGLQSSNGIGFCLISLNIFP